MYSKLDVSKRALILGIDPGSTLGLCIIDMSAKGLGVFSIKDARLHNVINKILEFGMPIIISCDKKKTPESVNKISRKLGCKIISPKRDLLVSEKKRLILKNNCSLKINNSHERDACASAYYAFSRIKSSISKVKMGFREDLLDGYLFKKILVDSKTIKDVEIETKTKEKENRLNISKEKLNEMKQNFTKRSTKKNDDTKKETLQLKNQIYKEEISKLKENNDRLLSEIRNIQSDIDAKINYLAKEKIKRIESEKRLLSRINLQLANTNSDIKKEVVNLSAKIENLKEKLNNDELQRTILFLKSSSLKLKEIKDLRNQKIFIREIDYLRDFVIESFKKNNICVFYEQGLKKEILKLSDNDIESLNVSEVKGYEIFNFVFFRKADIKKLVEENNFLTRVIDDYKANRKKV